MTNETLVSAKIVTVETLIKIQDGFIAFPCVQLYTYKTLFT